MVKRIDCFRWAFVFRRGSKGGSGIEISCLFCFYFRELELRYCFFVRLRRIEREDDNNEYWCGVGKVGLVGDVIEMYVVF